ELDHDEPAADDLRGAAGGGLRHHRRRARDRRPRGEELTMAEEEHVGFIGLGIMGRPMSLNLLRAGYPMTVHSRSPAPVDELVEAGATRASSPREVAEASDVVITMLPDTPDVEHVLFGDDGVRKGLRGGALVIDMSTIEPLATRRFAVEVADAGGAMLDAPVSGGEKGAIDGTLSIMVGGSE